MPRHNGLSEKEKAFCDRYIVHKNATRAHREAGYSCKDNNVHGVEGHKILKKPKIKEYLAKRAEEVEERYRLSIDDCLGVLARIAKSNPMDYIKVNDEGMAEIDLSQLSRDQAEAIQSITTETTYNKKGEKVVVNKLNFYNKDNAAINYGKHLGGFKTNVVHSGTVELADRLKRARGRAKEDG